MGAALLTLLSSPFRFLKGIFQSQASHVTDITDCSASVPEESECTRDLTCYPYPVQKVPLQCRQSTQPEDQECVCTSLQPLPEPDTPADVCIQGSEDSPQGSSDCKDRHNCINIQDSSLSVRDSEDSPSVCHHSSMDLPNGCTERYARVQPLTPYQIQRGYEQNCSNSSIQRQFGKMFNETYKSLKARYTLSEFKIHLIKISPSDEVSKEISQAESYMKALIAVHHLWSWENYRVFRKLLLTLGDADDIQRLEHYDQQLTQYLANKETVDCDTEDQQSQMRSSPDDCDQDNRIIFPQCYIHVNSQKKANQESTNHPGDHSHKDNWDPYAYPGIIDHRQRSSSERALIQSICDDKLKKHLSKEDLFCENQMFCEDKRLKSQLWCHNKTLSSKTPEAV